MGVNATTSVPVYADGEILQASRLNVTNSGIPVFATTTTRDAGFGGTGEKVLAEGQMAYIENIAGSSAVQYYDGAAWQTLVVGGLTLVKTQTIGSAVSTVTVTDAFSATYDNYLVTVNGGVASTNVDLNIQLGSTTTGYYGFLVFGSSNSSTVNGEANSNLSLWKYLGSGDTNILSGNAIIQNPFLAKYTLMMSHSSRSNATYYSFSGGLQNTTSYTAFTITPSSGTLTGGTIRVYGYANS
jgi:hypothetical protein